jgi:hypothetical protein
VADVISAAERLLDLQILTADGRPAGKVDDLELTVPDGEGAPYLSAVLSGPLAFGPRLGGRLGVWWKRTAARLRDEPDPQPIRIDVAILAVESTDLRLTADEPETSDGNRLENWLRDHFIGQIPGAG